MILVVGCVQCRSDAGIYDVILLSLGFMVLIEITTFTWKIQSLEAPCIYQPQSLLNTGMS